MSVKPEAEFPPLEDISMDRCVILDRVWIHLNDITVNPDTQLYFYSALELRFAIESIFFELLSCLGSGEVPSHNSKTPDLKKFIEMLEDVNPELLPRAGEHLGFTITSDDVNRLTHIHGNLDRYLCFPRELLFLKDQEDWKKSLEASVLKGFEYLCKLTGHKCP